MSLQNFKGLPQDQTDQLERDNFCYKRESKKCPSVSRMKRPVELVQPAFAQCSHRHHSELSIRKCSLRIPKLTTAAREHMRMLSHDHITRRHTEPGARSASQINLPTALKQLNTVPFTGFRSKRGKGARVLPYSICPGAAGLSPSTLDSWFAKRSE